MVIRATCTICVEYFDSDKAVAACNCGHTFHEDCLKNWVVTNPTCPQCRRHATARNIIKLFFETPDDEAQELDPTKLKNELDTMSAEMRRREQEKNKLIHDNGKLLGEVKKRDKQIKTCVGKLESEQITTDTLKKQLSLLSLQMDQAKAAKKEAKRLKDKLLGLERFQLVMTSNADAVEDMLNECGDGAKASRELATYCVSLKREFQNGKESKRKLKDENERLKKENIMKGRKLMETSKELDVIERRARSLEDDLNQVEAEKSALKERLTTLHRSLESPGSGKSAISRLILESPAPSLLQTPQLSGNQSIDLDDVPTIPSNPSTPDFVIPPSPSIQAKSDCHEFNVPFIRTTSLATKRKRLKEQEEDDVAMSVLSHSSLFNSKRPMKEGIMKKGYNGMGGHEKFIQSSFSRPMPKKVARPQHKKTMLGKPALPSLDNFF